MGVEGGVMPLTVSGLVSLLLLATVGQDSHGDGLVNGILSGSPFLLTYAYMRIFRNGRRPHMDRDLLYSVIYGRSVSPEPTGATRDRSECDPPLGGPKVLPETSPF